MKLSGDGANIAAKATMAFLTFSFSGIAENVLSAAGNNCIQVHVHIHCITHERERPSIITSVGNHTFASVKGQEDYDFLKACFEPVWEEVGEVIAHPILYIREEQYSLDIVLGSDYKVQ